MAVAALVAWVVTALGGFVLLGKWIGSGGLRQQQDGTTRFPTGVVFGHFGLAAAGLVLWIAYLLLHRGALAWVAFVVLLPVALLGFTMVARWSAGRRRHATVGAGGAATGAVPAEQTLPVPVVAAHGVFAVATVVLVLLAALASG